jgi:hypothetical protein
VGTRVRYDFREDERGPAAKFLFEGFCKECWTDEDLRDAEFPARDADEARALLKIVASNPKSALEALHA